MPRNTMTQMTDTGGKLGARKVMRWQKVRQAREQFMTAGVKNSSKIVQSIKSWFTPKKTQKKTQQETKPVGFSYRGNNYMTKALGQYQYAGPAVQDWKKKATPHNISEYALAAAKADTTKDPDVYNFYNRNRLSQQYHNEAIAVGQWWMTDSNKYIRWIFEGKTPEEQNRRKELADEYLRDALHEVPTFDPDTNSYGTQMQFKADAGLPPWIEATSYNADVWEYYVTYSNAVVGSAVQAYTDARNQGREYARNPYKSAFAGSEQTGQVDSFLDVMIKAMDPSTVDEDLLGNYLRDYVWNPIKAGKLKTAAGNALWNLMDTMDVASRGVRALVAGETVLGGSGGREFEAANSAFDEYYNKTWEKYGVRPSQTYLDRQNHGKWSRINDAKFKGQNVYWVDLDDDVSEEDVHRAQELFMNNGGYSLLLSKHPEAATKVQLASGMSGLSDDEKKEITKKLDNLFEGTGIDWRDIYDDIDKNFFAKNRSKKDLKQALGNIKRAYTDVDANFNADTGSLASDVIIETVLDPGTLAGGVAKNIIGKGVESAAETAVRRGLADIALDDDTAKIIMNNKYVRGAFNQFIKSNEGRNIIFRSVKDFENDVDNFIDKLRTVGVFSKDETASVFKRTVTNELMNKNVSINSAIIATQKTARDLLDSKTFKAAYAMDKAIDGIDSAIIKSSFFLPWAGLKGAKAIGDGIVNSELLRKAAKRLNLHKANAVQDIIDKRTGKVDVTRVSDLMRHYEDGMHRESGVRYALQQIVDTYDNITWKANDLVGRFSKGEITDEEAFRAIGDMIYEATGGRYRYVQELAGYVDDLAVRYSGDIKEAYGRLDNVFTRLQNLVDHRSENAVSGFLDKVRQTTDIEELGSLFREYMDNPYVMDLTDDIIDNTQFDISAKRIEDLKTSVKNGLFSEKNITRDDIKRGIQAQTKVSEKTLERTIRFDQFDDILRSMGVKWETAITPDATPFERKLSDFMSTWDKQKYVTYNLDDALKFIDRLERQVHLSELMQTNVPSQYSALAAHRSVGQFNALRRHIKKMDLIGLKDVKYVTLPQMDRMAMNLEFRNNKDIQNMYSGFYDDVIAPFWNRLKSMNSDEVELMDSTLFDDIDMLARQKYGFDRTSQLIEQAKTLPGFSDEHLHSFMNTLATDFRFQDDMGNIVLSPGDLRRRVEATLRAQTGQSKVGMKNITDYLQTLDSDSPSKFLEPYWEEFTAHPALKARYERYVNTDVLDPKAYVEKQMLFTVLADPSVIPEWNALAKKGQAPIAMHINSTGLNTEINSMTSVAFRKWVPIEVDEANPLTLEKLLDAMDSGETTVFQRHMLDSEFDEYTEQVIRQLDIKDGNPDNIMKRLKDVYGIGDGQTYKSESSMVEEVCEYLNAASITKEGEEGLRSVSPVLLVHDLDGFNINYFNNKVGAMTWDENSKAYDYLNRLARSAKNNTCNTYTRLAEQVGDLYYTAEQLDVITTMLYDYIDDVNHFASGYRFNDMQSYSRKLHDMISTLGLKENANELTDIEAEFLEALRNADGVGSLAAYDSAVKSITDLGLYPRQFAFINSNIDENFTKAALDATGRTAVNTGSRIYVDDLLSYFDLNTEDGFYTTIEDLRKMHEVSQYVTRVRNRQIVAGAEEFLLPYKEGLDSVIQAMINIANNNTYSSTGLSYLQHMKVPDNAIDSFILAKKLYNDHLKYWLDIDELTSLRTGGMELDALKEELYMEAQKLGLKSPKYKLDSKYLFDKACDYVNNNRTRFFDELTAGGFSPAADASDDILELLHGAHEPEIFNWAARSDYEKQILTYKNGVMKSGLDKATHYIEAGSQIKSEMRQLQHIDEYFATAGIVKRQDRMTASVYSKSKQLFDILDEGGFLKRDSFHEFMQKATRMQRLRLSQYRLNTLKNVNGEFDRYKLLSELVYNGFNMSVFNAYNYTPSEMDDLVKFVKGLQDKGDDFLSLYEDRTTGNIYIYLNNNATIAEADGGRWINRTLKFERPVYDAVPFADFDELVKVLDIDDIEDFRGVYAHLQSCWEDTRLLSYGRINGTTGRTVSRAQAESFLQSLPSNMNDWCTSEGLLRDVLTRDVIYDPGFVINEESDMLTDFLGTLQRQAETAKDDCILINEVFHSNSSVQFSELAENFTTDELIEYFGNNSEYVVCTVVDNPNTATGLQVRQLNLNNRAGVEAARTMQNTTILPYSTYYEVSNYMNRDVTDNVYKQLLGKYMLVYKAFALVKPGTWMRNFIDATSKAAFDNGQGLNGLADMAHYEAMAAKNIGDYGRILATDPKLLTPANWDVIQRTYKTDMTFEDFELLRGVMDSDRYKSADKYFLNRTARANAGFTDISGENIGLRNLDEKDIKAAFRKYLADEVDLPLNEREFLDIYFGRVVPNDVMNEQYEDMFRKLSNNLRNANAATVFDKTIDSMFKPFSQVEELVRYAQTLMLRDQGFSQNQITRHIHNTQFYNAPVWGSWRKLECIMPFITFKYNNMMYWVRMMDENPRLFRYFEDTYRSIYDTSIESALQEGAELDYENDYGLQSGAIPIGNGQRYFNIGNSFLSAMNDFYGFPHDIDSLNPLLRDTVRTSLYALGLNSKQFFSNLDLELTDEEFTEHAKQLIPGYALFKRGAQTFNNISGLSTSSTGPTMDAIYETLNFMGVFGVRRYYGGRDGRFSFREYQAELAKQGKWYDANLGRIVSLSEYNEYGANDPNNTFEDIQTYMMVHFGKLWDANQNKFVTMDKYKAGGLNDGFDFENDPQAWEKLCEHMRSLGKIYDYNQRKFVYPEDFIAGGLNTRMLDWDTKVTLMEEKFPNLIWDANQNAFVEKRYYIAGGMNDFAQYQGDDFLAHWNELKSLRLALYGETYNQNTHKFEKTGEPALVMINGFMDQDTMKRYDNYYSLLAIPRINTAGVNIHVNNDGFLVNDKGQYLLTGNKEYDSKVFARFKQILSYGGRQYNGNKNYSYNKVYARKKPYKGRSLAPTYYQQYAYNNGYKYREEFEYNYQYTSPNPGAKLNYLISPPKHYPYGGGYNKFSFINRY